MESRATWSRRSVLRCTVLSSPVVLIAGCGDDEPEDGEPESEEGTGDGQEREDDDENGDTDETGDN